MHPSQNSEKSPPEFGKITQHRKAPRLLSLKDTCRYLGGIPVKSLYNRTGARSKNPFPVRPKRIGRRLFWDIKDLDAYVDSL